MTCQLCERTDSQEIFNDGVHSMELCPVHQAWIMKALIKIWLGLENEFVRKRN